MNLRYLKIFIAVAELGNMHTAARQLYIAQPAISQAISEIENHYHTKLFERLSKKLYITPAGEQFLFYARHILALYDELEQEMSNKIEHSQLKVGATITIGTCIIRHLLSEFHKTYPNVEVQVSINTANFLAQELLHNGLDIALVESAYNAHDLVAEPFLDDEMILICSPKHPFAISRSADLEQISKANYIAREEGSHELFADYMNLHNLSLKMSWKCNNSETTKQAVMDNYGITVISRRIVKEELESGSLVEVKMLDCSITRTIQMLYHKNKYFSDTLTELAEICRNLEAIIPC